MKDIPYVKEMDPKTKAIAIIIVLLCVGLIVGGVISKISIDYAERTILEKWGEDITPRVQRLIDALKDMYTLGTIIICTNIFLLLGLLFIYGNTLRKTKSSFIFGLLLFIGILFIQSIISLPILHATLGYLWYSVSLFGVLPNMFETIALIILLYLSME
jgi:hypothetical protein